MSKKLEILRKKIRDFLKDEDKFSFTLHVYEDDKIWHGLETKNVPSGDLENMKQEAYGLLHNEMVKFKKN